MSDNELRDRIAAAIAGEEEHPHPRGYAAHAQAVIDDLGLAVERGQFNESGGGQGGIKTQAEAEVEHEKWEERRKVPAIDEPPSPPSTGVWTRVVSRWERVE